MRALRINTKLSRARVHNNYKHEHANNITSKRKKSTGSNGEIDCSTVIAGDLILYSQ